jgi:hypothetical protein
MGATQESDDKLRSIYRMKGKEAREDGVARDACPVDGLLKYWWVEGWDGKPPYPAVAS